MPETLRAIHQFSPSCAVGDGVSNGMLFTRRLLRELGFESDIYCEHIPHDMAAEVRHLDTLPRDPSSWLLVHHAFGYEGDAWLADFADRAILVYHNITPAGLLPAHGAWRRLAALGREQLVRWRPLFRGAVGVSALNASELRDAGYEDPRVLPLLVDVDAIRAAPWDASMLERYRDTTNLLFVGRVAPNKRQDLLLESFAEYLHFTDEHACLILPGKPMTDAFLHELQSKARALGIERHVDFLGPVSDTALRGLYRAADLFVCASDHEGFGMPLIEASVFDVPVIARATSNIPDTLGEGGLLLSGEDPREFGALMQLVLSEPGLRRRVMAGQQSNLRRFETARVKADLCAYLRSLGARVPIPADEPPSMRPAWRVEGPFDSSYSLAIVNRETARALERQGERVALSVTPGAGEPDPDPVRLSEMPDVAVMAARAGESGCTDVTLRFTYPPYASAMAGRVRVFHGYGWEETGFPARYVGWINRKLDLVTVLAREVGKILRDAGVRVPIAVAGAGIDQMLGLPDSEPPRPLGKRYRFLHVSSCFPRKGVDVLLAAYGRAFRSTDDVSLVIKTFPNPHNDVAEQLQALRGADPGYPDVVLISEDWPEPAMAGLYRRCHAFVAPSRGEGFGLPMSEAMAFRLPVITTGWGGQTDFCTQDTAWLVDYTFAPARTHLAVDHSAWAEPDADHLAQLMAAVHRATPAELAPRLEAAQAQVLRDHTWSEVARRTRAALIALDRAPTFRRAPRVGWVTTWNIRCGIATYSGYLSQAIPADRLQIFAGRSAEPVADDAANVLRCWDSGVHGDALEQPDLDDGRPRLVDGPDDDLLRALDDADLDAIVIQYNFGFYSTSRLARLIHRGRQRGRQVHVFLHATADPDKRDLHSSLKTISPALALADRVYVHSIDDLNRLRGRGLASNAVLFPHGIPVAPAMPDPARRAAAGLAGRRVVATYGFLLPHKGLAQLVEAFAAMRPDANDLHLVLSCALYPDPRSTDERDAIVALVARLGLESRVTLVTDFLSDDESFGWLQQADLVVFPYQHTKESASGAVRMGIASGRPVAVTPLPIFDDVADVVHRLPGISPVELAEGILRLLDDPALLASRAGATERFLAARAWPALARRFANIVDGIANDLDLDGDGTEAAA